MTRPLPTQKQKKPELGYFAQLPPGPIFFTPHSPVWTDLSTPKKSETDSPYRRGVKKGAHPCAHCGGKGIEPPGHHIKACTVCNGFGHVWKDRNQQI